MKSLTKRKIKRKIRNFFLNIPLFIDMFILYPILFLLYPSRIPYWVLRKRADLKYRLSKKLRAKVAHAMGTRHPDRPAGPELDEMVRRFFWIQETFFFDSFYIVHPLVRLFIDRYVEYRGLEHLDRSLAGGKGVVIATFHFHHPCFAPGHLVYQDYPVTAYAVHPRDLNVPLLAKVNAWWPFAFGPLRTPLRMVWAGRSGGALLRRAIAQGRIGLALIDASLPDRKGLAPVRMLGDEMFFPSRIVDIIHESEAPVHIAYTMRDSADWRRSIVTVSEPLEMSGVREADFQTIISAFEEVVVAHPGHWWGWAGLERATAEYHAEYRRLAETVRQEEEE